MQKPEIGQHFWLVSKESYGYHEIYKVEVIESAGPYIHVLALKGGKPMRVFKTMLFVSYRDALVYTIKECQSLADIYIKKRNDAVEELKKLDEYKKWEKK